MCIEMENRTLKRLRRHIDVTFGKQRRICQTRITALGAIFAPSMESLECPH